ARRRGGRLPRMTPDESEDESEMVESETVESEKLERAPIERDLGEQPLARLLSAHGLAPRALVSASTEQITHKMVQRACRGRRLSAHVMLKILNALNAATGKGYTLNELFDYAPPLRA